jgi:chemotaxis protein CheC
MGKLVEAMDTGGTSVDCALGLTPFLKDALNELGNIASCHAVTALAEMTGTTIEIDIPSVEVVSLQDVGEKIELEKIVAGDFVKLEGGLSGYLLVLFPESSAFSLVDALLGKKPGATKGIETEMDESALTEAGNILASAFCSAIADLLQFTLMPTPPSFAFDMAGALVENAILAVAHEHGTEHIILCRCDFPEGKNDIYGYILLFPHPDSLKGLLSLLEEKVEPV